MKTTTYKNDAWALWPAVGLEITKDGVYLHILVFPWEIILSFKRGAKR